MPRRRASSNTLSRDIALAAHGYRMPAEWEPHAATWLAWPHYVGDWPGKFEPIPWVFAEVVRNLARQERVELLVNDASAERKARKFLDRANALSTNLRFHRWPTNRVWMRDSGCIFLTQKEPGPAQPGSPLRQALGKLFGSAHIGVERTPPLGHRGGPAALKFRFNAWVKYSNWRHDEKIGTRMAQAAPAREIRPVSAGHRIVLEGGSIDVNGRGTLLTTEECLLSKVQERNPGFTKQDYAEVFREYLGVEKVIWLERGIAGDDTHGHVDDITRFVGPRTVVTAYEPDPDDPNHEPLNDNFRWLKKSSDQSGKPLK